MAFENWAPKKQETPVENTVENNESVESQIEQETVKLDANLESLKAEIDEMGGVEKLSKRIIENKNNIQVGKMMGTIIPSITLVLPLLLAYTSPGGIDGFLEAVSGDTNDAVITITTRIIAGLQVGAGALGAYLVGSTAPSAIKSWWENRKLKSLKNKAEKAGIA